MYEDDEVTTFNRLSFVIARTYIYYYTSFHLLRVDPLPSYSFSSLMFWVIQHSLPSYIIIDFI